MRFVFAMPGEACIVCGNNRKKVPAVASAEQLLFVVMSDIEKPGWYPGTGCKLTTYRV